MAPHSNPRFAIERAVEADIDAVVDCWLDLAADQREYGSRVRSEANRAVMRDILNAHRVTDGLLVARLDEELVGFASFSVESGSLELDATRGLLSNLYVTPSVRGRGIGSALLEAVEAELADRGVDVLTLEVMAANDAARRFYERAGYDEHRVAMQRPLDSPTESDTHSKEDG